MTASAPAPNTLSSRLAAPAAPAAVVCLVAAGSAPPMGCGGALVVALVAAALVLVASRADGRRRLLFGLASFGLVIAATAGLRLQQLRSAPLVELGARAGSGAVEVTVVGEPRAGPFGSWRTDVRVETLDSGRSGLRAELVDEDRHEPGTRLAGRVEVRPAEGSWRTSRHVAVVLTRPRLTVVGAPGRILAATTALRERLGDLASGVLPPGPAGLATGLVTGDTRLLPPQDEVAMRATGLTHLTAVSGSNVALVATGAGLVVGAFGVGARGRRRTVVLALAAFLVLTRADPSVLRATAMAGVVLTARARGRRIAGPQALAAALLVLLLLDPLLSRRLGLLLSAAATAGVLLVTPAIRARLGTRDGQGGLRRRVLDLLAVTLGAQLAVLPVLLAIGEDVRLATVPANLVAVPVAAVASVLVTTAAVLVMWAPGVAGLLLALARPALATVLGIAHGLRWWGPAVGPAAVAVLAGLVVVVAVAVSRGVARHRIVTAVALGVLCVALVPAPADRGAFVLSAIDVGQGDAFLLRAGDVAVLVDTGRDERAATWLRRAGVRRLDLLVFTHADADHTGGGRDVLAAVDVGAVWQRPRQDAAPPTLAGVLEAAHAEGVPVHAPRGGQHVDVGPLRLTVLAPAGAASHAGLDALENESSVVLRVDGPGGAVLLTGDTGPAAHAELLGMPELIDVEVVTVPHHGSRHVELGLVPATTPQVAVVSVGADNGYGHPTAEALDAVAAAGATLRRTDLEGTVHVVVGAPTTAPRLAAAPGRVAPRGYGRRHATVHPRDLRRPAAAAAGCRSCARRRPGRRRDRAHRRRGGGAPGRPHSVVVRRHDRAPAALREGALRRDPRRADEPRRQRRGRHRDRGRREARHARHPGVDDEAW